MFKTPFPVQPRYEDWKTPGNYRHYANGKDLPPTLKVWRVQETLARYGGVVSIGDGFEDSPDCEILTLGCNTKVGPRDVGVGRHGNFLQWGFAGSPAQMTEAGKNFFLNCIVYIKKFDGKAPLVQREANERHIGREAVENMIKSKHLKDAPIEQYMELVYGVFTPEKQVWYVDSDLPALGLTSNRKLETLKSLVALLDDPQKQALARKVLERYTIERFERPEQWKTWLTENEGRFFFSDVGGYKFTVVPKGYLNR